MFTKTKIALAAAIVLSAAFSASAATNARVAPSNQTAYNEIPGYDSQGNTVAIPDPDQSGASSQR
jgi:hypothetical protein